MVESISTNPAYNAGETYCKGVKVKNHKYIISNKQVSSRLDAIGHTVLWLCDRMSISQQTYYNWIKTGTNKGRLLQMADELGCKPADLV